MYNNKIIYTVHTAPFAAAGLARCWLASGGSARARACSRLAGGGGARAHVRPWWCRWRCSSLRSSLVAALELTFVLGGVGLPVPVAALELTFVLGGVGLPVPVAALELTFVLGLPVPVAALELTFVLGGTGLPVPVEALTLLDGW